MSDDIVLPAASAQLRFLLLHGMAEHPGALTLPRAFELRGDPNIERLAAAVSEVVRRHEALRTTFENRDGVVHQRIRSHSSNLEVVDLRDHSDVDDPRTVDLVLAANDVRPFDVFDGEVFSVRLVRLSDRRWLLLLAAHHIAVDAWSWRLILREISAVYAGEVLPTPLPYRQVAMAESAWLTSPDAEDQVRHWVRLLSGVPDPMPLPGGVRRPERRQYVVENVPLPLTAELATAMDEAATRWSATRFMVLLATLARLWHRECGVEEVVFGTPAGGRMTLADESAVGPILNTVVLRLPVPAEASFADLVGAARSIVLDALDHAAVPFDRVVSALHPPRSRMHPPLCQVMVMTEDDTSDALTLPEVEVVGLPRPAQHTSELDLTVILPSSKSGAGRLEYAADVYNAKQAADLAARIVATLAAELAEQRSESASRTPARVLSDHDRRQMLEAWNDTARPLPPTTIVSLFSAQVARNPAAIAVVNGRRSLTYAELDTVANRLAHELRRAGAGPESCVAVAMPRSVELVIALIGILKSGAAYLPIDPELPAGRVRSMLDDARPVAVLDRAEQVYAPNTLSDTPPVVALLPENPAYIIYTSGSTGRPKGVVVEHRTVAAYLTWALATYQGLSGTALVPSPVSFDLTVTGLFGPLVAGGTVRLAAIDDTATGMSGRPTFLKVTPSHLPLLDATTYPDIDLVVGGEALTGEQLSRWRDRFPDVTVVNEYGPTEATVGCVAARIAPGEPTPSGAVPIGRPIWNTRVYLLDRHLEPVPPGVKGELYVAGQLARGYLGSPALTADRFLPCPYGPAGERMYRTGDLARWDEDGNLWYLGRTDDQVKIRGHRVELTEVETVLGQQCGVVEAAAAVRDGHLVAYVVPDQGSRLDPDELRQDVAAILPGYMVPSTFLMLERLPLNSNGKLNRDGLPKPDRSVRNGAVPRTPTEQVVAGIWAEVLGCSQVTVDEPFVDLGGDSIRSILVAARVAEAFGVRLGARDVFTDSTVAGLARRIDKAR